MHMNKRSFWILLLFAVPSFCDALVGNSNENYQSDYQSAAADYYDTIADSFSDDQNVSKSQERSFFWDRNYSISARSLQGNGVGFNKGYSSLDTLILFSQMNGVYPFFDLRGHLFNDGKWAANAGFGMRFKPESKDLLIGFNAFYDYRDATHSHFNQFAGGLEFSGPRWDININGYFPFGKRKHFYRSGFERFQGHSAFFLKKAEFPFIGGDLRIGTTLYSHPVFNFYASMGAYDFYGQYGKNAAGGFFDLKLNVTSYLTFEGWVSYDSNFRWRGNGELRLTIPFGLNLKGRVDSEETWIANKLSQHVPRFEIIVTDIHKKRAIARNPSTNDPYYFLFVDNAFGSSDGSIENPFTNFTEAQAASSPGDVIYVFPGNGTSQGMNLGITLLDDQILTGANVTLPALTSFGLKSIPPQASTAPIISNTGDTVTLGNNNTVSGFAIISTGGNGISGTNTTNATITDNAITSNSTDINLSSFTGTAIITGNASQGTNGININGQSDTNGFAVLISNNNFANSNTGNSTSIIIADFSGAPLTSFVTISSNRFIGDSGATSTLTAINVAEASFFDTNLAVTIVNNSAINLFKFMDIESSFGGTLSADIDGNIGSSFGGDGIFLNSSSTSTPPAASMNAVVTNNVVLNANLQAGGSSGININAAGVGTGTINSLKLVNNIASAPASSGFTLTSPSAASFVLQSPAFNKGATAALNAVEALNTGSFSATAANFTYIPLQ